MRRIMVCCFARGRLGRLAILVRKTEMVHFVLTK